MNENLFHAGALALFVALCIGAAVQGKPEQATRAAAQRTATIAARQADRSPPDMRLARLQTSVETMQGAG